MKISHYSVVVKPALVVLVLAVVAAYIGKNYMGRFVKAADVVASDGLLRPKTWKFEVRPGANATLSHLVTKKEVESDKSISSHRGIYAFDMKSGVIAQVSLGAAGKASTESVYFRSGLSMASVKPATKSLRLSFEACGDPAPFAVLATIRDQKTLLWHQLLPVTSTDWKPYSATVPVADLSARKFENLPFSIQIGDQKGTLSLRNVRLDPVE